MPAYLTRLLPSASKKETTTLNRLEGITASGAVVLRDRRGTRRAEIPAVSEKGITLGDDPLAIYKPTGAKNVDASKAMGSFTGWTYAAVNAIASEVANIQLRLYQIRGDDHEEQDDHALLELLERPNEHMTGIELKAPEYQVKSVKDLTHAEYMEHWKRFADRSERAEEELRRIFRGINAKQKAEVLENLPEATGVAKALGELFDPKEWIAITIDLVTPVLTSLARDEAAAALAMIGATHEDILANDIAGCPACAGHDESEYSRARDVRANQRTR